MIFLRIVAAFCALLGAIGLGAVLASPHTIPIWVIFVLVLMVIAGFGIAFVNGDE